MSHDCRQRASNHGKVDLLRVLTYVPAQNRHSNRQPEAQYLTLLSLALQCLLLHNTFAAHADIQIPVT